MSRTTIGGMLCAALALAGCGASGGAARSTNYSTSNGGASASASTAFLETHSSVSTVASTVPRNGDLNPYGVALVPASGGRLHAGEILVSNFNDKGNEQGTGTTIDQISAVRAASRSRRQRTVFRRRR